MNNYALKLVKEKGSVSLKVNNLYRFPEDEFHNLKKMELYEKGKRYHKSQKGIFRVSKFEFFSSKEKRLAMLKKHPVEISNVKNAFDYVEGDADTKVWYMNFADKEAFDDRDTRSFSSLTDLQIMEMPLLYKANRFLNTDPYACITPTTYYMDGKLQCPTPVLFENVPQWFVIKNTIEVEKNQIISRDKKNNIIAMIAPCGSYEVYQKDHLYFLCSNLFAGFGGIIYQGIKSKVRKFELHTGNWGCGHFNNNKELIYLSQMIVASVMGIQKLCFHFADETAFTSAKSKYEKLIDEFNYEEIVSYLETQQYKKN